MGINKKSQKDSQIAENFEKIGADNVKRIETLEEKVKELTLMNIKLFADS